MGDWIKENKFEAALAGVVLLAIIGAFLLGGKQGQEYQLQKELFENNKRKKAALESKRPYPDQVGQDNYTEEVEDYAKVVEALQDKLLAYRPAEFKKITPSEFTEALNAAKATVTEQFEQGGVKFPADKFHLGFAKYNETPPRDGATPYLNYQLDAMAWLFGAFAQARPSELLNVYRKELPIESGPSMDPAPEVKPGTTSRRRGSNRSRSTGPGEPFYRLPVEVTFRAPEPAARQFLAAVASNDQHFFVVRTLRIQNEKRDKAPKKDDVEFKAGPAGNNAFDNAFENELIPEEPAPEGDPLLDEELPEEDLPEEDPLEPLVPENQGSGERILGQVLGSEEEVFVFVELELFLFKPKDEVEMPEL